MASILLTPPTIEPVTLADAKAFVRVETADDDDVIAASIAGARIHVETQTRRALITQTWRMVLDAWPDDGLIEVLPAPLDHVAAARIYKTDGSTQAIDADSFVAATAEAPALLCFAAGILPQPARRIGGIEIDFVAGYGAAAADVPETLRQAIRILVAHWYENRAIAVAGQTLALLPASVGALVAPFRVLSL